MYLIFFRLIFKHRVITKAKLGRNVVFDMGKFKVNTVLFSVQLKFSFHKCSQNNIFDVYLLKREQLSEESKVVSHQNRNSFVRSQGLI